MYIYQKTGKYFAQVSSGLEEPAGKELHQLGAQKIQPGFRGVYFSADFGVLYTVNYKSRLISHVLAPLASFECKDREDLYRHGKNINWPDFMTLDNSFAVIANVSANERIRHSKFAALCVKDAVADHFRSKFGKRPNVDTLNADLWINLHIRGERATISLDTSGGPLHRRGYRKASVEAPIMETLAAALIEVSGWQGEKPLFDPMCGSGTILCEAVMKACNIPAGFFRKKFGVFLLPDFDQNLWKKTRETENRKVKNLTAGLVSGSDLDHRAVRAAKINCQTLPGGDAVHIFPGDFKNIDPLENTMIITNPPYGVRLKKQGDLENFYRAFGDFLKQKCKGSQAVVYFGNREMIKCIGLKASWKKPMKNAALDGRAVKYELY